MIQSIQDYENWRDRQYDLPEPDSTTPDEHATYAYSHDYPDDTKLEYVRDGEHAELRLSFTSEDPDTSVEEMLLGSDNVESLPELASDLRADISSYLDAQDTSSFSSSSRGFHKRLVTGRLNGMISPAPHSMPSRLF